MRITQQLNAGSSSVATVIGAANRGHSGGGLFWHGTKKADAHGEKEHGTTDS